MTDNEFGLITIRENARSKGFTFRSQQGGLLVTVPPHWTESELMESIERIRPKLRQLIKRVEQKKGNEATHTIDWNFHIKSELLSFSIVPDPGLKQGTCSIHKEMGQVSILCHPEIDFQAEGMQAWLTKVIEEQIRSYAKGILPARLRALSKEFNLPIRSVHINSSHGRWGSCSRHVKKNLLGIIKEDSGYSINLSLYTLLLPGHLQRLIMLHELTHTLEMNHSPRFHAKLNAMLGGTEAQLEKELKQYSTNIFTFTAPLNND